MELRFSRSSLLNNVLRDEQGKPVYRIESPFKAQDRTTTLSQILPGPNTPQGHDNDRHHQEIPSEVVHMDNASDTDILLAGMEERVVGQILWQGLKQSVFTLNGREHKLKEYFPATSVWTRKRSFVATDGNKYIWTIGVLGCWMKRSEDSHTILVKYHMRSLGIIGKARLPWLEISEDVVPILDEVLLTFIWLERRRERGDQPGFDFGSKSS